MSGLKENCNECGHPIGWHPRPGSPSDVNGMGCLECSCHRNTHECYDSPSPPRPSPDRSQS